MSDAQYPPAWHPDPWQQAPWRWWDGTRWTEHTHLGTDDTATPVPAQADSNPAEDDATEYRTDPAATVDTPTAGGEAATRAACPYCGVVLDPPPKANRKCPDCREQLVVRTQQGTKLVFTPDDAARFDAERERGYREREVRRRADGLGITDHDWQQTEQRLQVKFGSKPSPGDTYWSLANRAVNNAASDGDWQQVSMIYRQMALHLRSEGRGFLHLLRECLRASIRSDLAQHQAVYGEALTHFRVLGCRGDCDPCAPDTDAVYPVGQLMADDGPVPHDCDFCACAVIPVRQS